MTNHLSYLSSINKMAETTTEIPTDEIGVQPNLKPKKRVHIMTEKRQEALKKATAARMQKCAARRESKAQAQAS